MRRGYRRRAFKDISGAPLGEPCVMGKGQRWACSIWRTMQRSLEISTGCAIRAIRPISEFALQLYHRQRAPLGAERKGGVDYRDLGRGKNEIAGAGVFLCMPNTRRFGNRKHRIPPGEKSERRLACGCAMRLGDLGEHAAAVAAGIGKVTVAEGTVGDDSHPFSFAPRYDRVLDCPLLEVIKHLVAGDLSCPGDFERCVEISIVEVAHSPGEDFALALQILEGGDRFLKRMRAAPMQEIAIEPVGLESLERFFASRPGAIPRRILRQNFRDQENL